MLFSQRVIHPLSQEPILPFFEGRRWIIGLFNWMESCGADSATLTHTPHTGLNWVKRIYFWPSGWGSRDATSSNPDRGLLNRSQIGQGICPYLPWYFYKKHSYPGAEKWRSKKRNEAAGEEGRPSCRSIKCDEIIRGILDFKPFLGWSAWTNSVSEGGEGWHSK